MLLKFAIGIMASLKGDGCGKEKYIFMGQLPWWKKFIPMAKPFFRSATKFMSFTISTGWE